VRSEGESYAGRSADARAEIFWDHAVARWWNLEVGGRQDFGAGPARRWAALGVRGLAPQGFDVEATLYAGAASRTAVRLKIEYELLFTQRLVLQPEIEMNFYSRADPARDIGAGLADFEAGLRLRYELRREFAPYAGVVWARHYGATGVFLGTAGAAPNELSLAVGLRVWL
jgi:copper resistance protein B